jgi:hypothetical protein
MIRQQTPGFDPCCLRHQQVQSKSIATSSHSHELRNCSSCAQCNSCSANEVTPRQRLCEVYFCLVKSMVAVAEMREVQETAGNGKQWRLQVLPSTSV